MVPQVVGGAVIDSVQNGEGICLEGVDGAFGYITAMEIREHELELFPPLLFDVELVGCTAFIVKDLEATP